jgi:hypothetical protein
MKKTIAKLLLVSATLFQTASAQDHPCKDAFTPVYTHLSVSSDKDMVQKLHHVYSATTQQEYESRRSGSGNVGVFDFGSAGYSDSKRKIENLYSKIQNTTDYELDYAERLDVLQSFSRPEDVELSLRAWGNCMASYYNLPHLELMNQSKEDSSVSVKFTMKPIQCTWRKSAKVLSIMPSSNLTLDTTTLGDRAAYFTDYYFEFKRKNFDKASLAISLDGIRVNPLFIPRINNDSVMAEVIIEKELVIAITQDVSGNKIRVTPQGSPTQTITFGNQSKKNYKLTLKINTTIPNDANVKSVSLVPSSGYYKQFKFEGIRQNPNGTITINCYTLTGSKKMKGKIEVAYTVKERRCVSNCRSSRD